MLHYRDIELEKNDFSENCFPVFLLMKKMSMSKFNELVRKLI